MIKSTFTSVLNNVWPTLVILEVVIILMRIFYIKNSGKKFILHEELLLLLFVAYILMLFDLVTSRDVYLSGTNLVPFKEILRYSIGSENFNRQVIGNIILFIPLGFFFTYYTRIKKIGSITIIAALISFTIETVQKYIGRSFDIDDIILNVVGGIIGFLIYVGLDAIKKKLPDVFRRNWFYAFITLVLIVLLVLYALGIIVL